MVWPLMTGRRLILYYRHRIGRLSGTPYYIAAGFATGVAVSFTPFIGFHLLMGSIIAWILRGSLMAMVLGTVVAGNPWTLPLIWMGTYKAGVAMLGQSGRETVSSVHPFTWADLLDKPLELLLPMSLGCLPAVIVSGAVSFFFVRHAVKGYKETRRRRLQNIRKNN